MSQYIGSSVWEIDAGQDAPMTAGVLEKLKDMDANRIAKSDDIVMRKAVLALLTVVVQLESRIISLESATTTRATS